MTVTIDHDPRCRTSRQTLHEKAAIGRSPESVHDVL